MHSRSSQTRMRLSIIGVMLLLVGVACNFEILPEGIEQRIITAIDEERYEDALRDLAKMERFSAVVDVGWVHGERAYVYLKQKAYEKAVDEATKAIEAKPAREGAPAKASYYQNRASAYQEMGKHKEAEADYTTAISLEPGRAKRYQERGLFYMHLRNHAAALSDMSTAIAIDPGQAENYLFRADLHMAERRRNESVVDLRKALELGAGSWVGDAAIQRLRILGIEP